MVGGKQGVEHIGHFVALLGEVSDARKIRFHKAGDQVVMSVGWGGGFEIIELDVFHATSLLEKRLDEFVIELGVGDDFQVRQGENGYRAFEQAHIRVASPGGRTTKFFLSTDDIRRRGGRCIKIGPDLRGGISRSR